MLLLYYVTRYVNTCQSWSPFDTVHTTLFREIIYITENVLFSPAVFLRKGFPEIPQL